MLLGISLGFGGCGGEAPKATKVPISPAAPKPAASKPGKEAPRPAGEVKAVEPPPPVSFTYNPEGKPNPFQPLVVERAEAPAGPKKSERASAKAEDMGPGTPLERMDLNAFKLVAVVWDIPNPRAMVEDSTGKGYILTLGTRIGKNKGKVMKVTPAGVVVREIYETEGKGKTREIPLRLYTE